MKSRRQVYMTIFCITMERTRFNDGERDVGYCQLFVENLAGAALNWFSRLEANTINNFKQLSIVFMKHYSMFTEKWAYGTNLWTVTESTLQPWRTNQRLVHKRRSWFNPSGTLKSIRGGCLGNGNMNLRDLSPFLYGRHSDSPTGRIIGLLAPYLTHVDDPGRSLSLGGSQSFWTSYAGSRRKHGKRRRKIDMQSYNKYVHTRLKTHKIDSS